MRCWLLPELVPEVMVLILTRVRVVPELISAVGGLLLEGEDHRPKVLVLREVIPVLRAVEVLLVRLLLDAGELELPRALVLLLDTRLLARGLVDDRDLAAGTHL